MMSAPGDRHRSEFIETVIVPRTRDLGGFEVRRVLPSRMRQMVGPFIFFDQMGPVEFSVGKGIDVRSHPHINLATVTDLFLCRHSTPSRGPARTFREYAPPAF